ncbi:unnamed protein product [Rhizophagus irregularis]|nr:unnamed protein product [Rhizophagus irregularis]CAB5365523.1 unnamed protein product [Rhizophagus irregularis]
MVISASSVTTEKKEKCKCKKLSKSFSTEMILGRYLSSLITEKKYFTYEKDKEHMLYKSALTMTSDERPAGFALASESGVRLPLAHLNTLRVSCHNATEGETSQSIEKKLRRQDRKRIDDSIKDSKKCRNAFIL